MILLYVENGKVMNGIQCYEVEGAVFREREGEALEIYFGAGKWRRYQGDPSRVRRMSRPMSLDEVRPYMDGCEKVAE